MTARATSADRPSGGRRLSVSVGRLRVPGPLTRWERAALPGDLAAALADRYAGGVDADAPPPAGAPLAVRLAAAVHRSLPADLPEGPT